VRPIRLRVKSFTAFRDETELDLSGLDVFAIAGPTGAGKSSLLDAITYALYGRVERVGEQVSQLISQGQPQMAVVLEFVVGADRWLLARRTQRGTPKTPPRTSAVLQRWIDSEWASEAGQVREVDERIKKLIGLDYAGFTRAVLLPQGKFDQFLAGDAKDRRRILNDLLGLGLFERMARHANRLATVANDEHRSRTHLLATEYAGVSPEALETAHERASGVRERETKLRAAYTSVLEMVRRRDEARRAAEELRACATEARRHGATAATAAKALTDLARDLATADNDVAAKTKAAQEASAGATKARATFEKEVERSGSARDLTAALSHAALLTKAREEAERSATVASQAEASWPALHRDATSAATAQREAETRLGEQKGALARAQAKLREAQHDHRVALVARGLKPGDPCPICGEPLRAAPKAPPATVVERAEDAVKLAESAVETADSRQREAERHARDAVRAVADAKKAVGKAKEQVAEKAKEIAGLETALKKVLGSRLPEDPVSALDARLADLEKLDAAAREADREAEHCAHARDSSAGARERILQKVETERVRLPADGAPLLRRARAAAPRATFPAFPAARADGLAALRDFAGELSNAYSVLAAELEKTASQRGGLEASFVAEARAVAGGLIAHAATLEELTRSIERAAREATEEAATAERDAEELERKLARRGELEREIEALAGRSALLRNLALDLKQDQIIDFLQAEALRSLAGAGSSRLAYLSGDRYRLRYRDDEFYVVDRWGGDEERSVRTLSGGETFLASLALALALSEQVRSLATTERARLDSLFLDEGFGTLDPETLNDVKESIDRLGGDGRLVGVISHISELTNQFPARVEVAKSQRGSRLKLIVP
jgi:exonuclease SbcC